MNKNSLSNPLGNLTKMELKIVEDRPTLTLLRNQLSHEQWAAIMPPLYTKEVNFDRWREFEWQVCLKWLAHNTTGWWYWDTSKWVTFEKIEDHVLFSMWARNEPMQKPDNMNISI